MTGLYLFHVSPAQHHARAVASQDGLKALALKPTGRALGHKRRLTAEQELHIQRLICKHRPEQLKLTFALWSRAAVLLLVQQEFGIELPIRTMSKYLKRWGFTPQKLITRAYEQRPEAVKAWLDDQYPAITQRAKSEDAEIHWGDETAVVNTDVRGRGYQPKGQNPVAYAVGGMRHKLSMNSTVTKQGKTRGMIVDDAFNSDKLIEFLAALINSPDLKPDERLNADLKYALGSRVQTRTKEKLKEATKAHMDLLEKQPERVRSYFNDPRVKYAA